jgi:hypothetical protein
MTTENKSRLVAVHYNLYFTWNWNGTVSIFSAPADRKNGSTHDKIAHYLAVKKLGHLLTPTDFNRPGVSFTAVLPFFLYVCIYLVVRKFFPFSFDQRSKSNRLYISNFCQIQMF